MLDKLSIDTSLNDLSKTNTPPEIFKAQFFELTQSSKFNHYTLIFTDGSKCDSSTAFSVTTANDIIKQAQLPDYSSVFAAEIIAIHESLFIHKDRPRKYAICTDSLSAIQAIKTINNNGVYAQAN